jgi:hypothetical protein
VNVGLQLTGPLPITVNDGENGRRFASVQEVPVYMEIVIVPRAWAVAPVRVAVSVTVPVAELTVLAESDVERVGLAILTVMGDSQRLAVGLLLGSPL